MQDSSDQEEPTKKKPSPEGQKKSQFSKYSQAVRRSARIDRLQKAQEQEERARTFGNPINYQERAAAYWEQRRAHQQRRLTDRPWIISPSTHRLHSIQEVTLELQEIEDKTEALRAELQDQAVKKRRLLERLDQLTQVQLEEQLGTVLSEYQEKLADPLAQLEANTKYKCLDRLGKTIGPSDFVEVDCDYTGTTVLGKVIQTVQQNIVLVRICSTGHAVGVFGTKIKVLTEE